MKENNIFPHLSEDDLKNDHTAGINFRKLRSLLFSPFHWFIHINDTIPDIASVTDVSHQELFCALTEHYSFNSANIIRNETYSDGTGTVEVKWWAVFLKKDLIICYDQSENNIQLIYGQGDSEECIRKWADLILRYTQEEMSSRGNESRIRILNQGLSGLTFTDFRVPRPELEIDLHYNDDFRSVHETIVRRLRTSNDSGLVLLHGIPGTGKTTYIRYLSFIINKPMVFIPQEISQDLSSVNFVSFMLDYPNSVLIIEDAENIVIDNGVRNFSVSSLLNVTDGLLSDCLNLQIICTFNTSIRTIDKALLRKGRLISRYEFRELDTEKASRLASRLGITDKISKPHTLADIYYMSKEGYTYSGIKKIGYLK